MEDFSAAVDYLGQNPLVARTRATTDLRFFQGSLKYLEAIRGEGA